MKSDYTEFAVLARTKGERTNLFERAEGRSVSALSRRASRLAAPGDDDLPAMRDLIEQLAERLPRRDGA